MGVSNIGYLLPDGDCYTEETECCFVFIPARDEYRRAFFGALGYFSTWLAWERDSAKRGRDAARAWKFANDLTMECWDMGACTDMLDKLDQLIALQQNSVCCAGNKYTTYNDNRIETTTIVPESGPAPTYYGETAVADWDEWLEYVCFHAHEFVDDLINAANKIDSLLDLGIWAIDAYFWLVRKIVFRNDGWEIPIDLSWAGNIFKAILQGGAGLFEIVASDLEDGREDIICALINGTSLSDAVEASISGTPAWTLFYQFLDYDSAAAVIYNGGIPEFGYLTPTKRNDCLCEIPDPPDEFLVNYHWRSGASPWTLSGGISYIDYEYSDDGFDIDGCLIANITPTGNDARSENFSWPGGRFQLAVLARSADTGTIAAWNTYVNVRVYRVSDNVLVWTGSTGHGGAQALWVLDTDLSPTSHPAMDYYVKVAIDGGISGYQRRVDYISLKLYVP